MLTSGDSTNEVNHRNDRLSSRVTSQRRHRSTGCVTSFQGARGPLVVRTRGQAKKTMVMNVMGVQLSTEPIIDYRRTECLWRL
ncbi:hypothetical protein TNIN_272791 [Trichonephila inaurata madagascariensis]|uniref:Uncharacterized protein n=1 Tax=Trichonephila inaurata madagascariensis TaxID=2747483 RepID=A0A8X6Y371_9ARAC|nr:hypothetical protein TNIN_272791 [Trichonephila inaurata madagascariensis]